MPEFIDITVQARQTPEDVALKHYGAVESVEWLMTDNREVFADGLNTALQTGATLRKRKGFDYELEYLADVNKFSIEPANGDNDVDVEGPDYNNDYNDDYE